MIRWLLPLMAALLFAAVPAIAAPLTVTKRAQTISDPLGNLLPRAIPGAEVDYTVTINNPNGVLAAVSGVTFADAIPAGTQLKVADLALLIPGPVEFIDGNVLGLLGSGLSYGYTSLRATGDGLQFSSDNGVTWDYQPVADGNGCDVRVTNIRVSLTGLQVAGSSFALRFRVRLR
ncbi:MAG: hypothetical protein ABW048_06135 [Sphingobium sp.]